MENIDPLSSQTVRFSLSTEGLPILQSTCSVTDEGLYSKQEDKGFSPGSNRLAPLLGKRLFMHYESGSVRNKQIELILTKLRAVSY